MRKFFYRLSLFLVLGLLSLLAIAHWGLGYSPIYIYNAPSVVTGIGAKLACSARYVSGYDSEKTARDIEVYSPILTLLDYQYDDTKKAVSASMLGIKTRNAHYQPGIGCALSYAGINERKNIHWPDVHARQEAWPAGNDISTIESSVQTKLEQMLRSDNQNGHDTRALLIAHKGKVIAEVYVDGIDESTPLLGWSMAKSVNSLMLGQLELTGAVNVAEKDLFPQWKADARSEISIEDLLHMTDGLDYQEDYDPGDTAVRMLFQEPDVAEYVIGRKLLTAPGEQFNYSSGTANVISRIIQDRIEGDVQADTDYLLAQFIQPLGMSNVTFEMDASGQYQGSSYIYATARDWARIGQLMLNKGEINGTRIVSESWVERSLQPNQSKNKPAYGYQWWLNAGAVGKRWKDLPSNTFAAMGNREQRVLVIPDEELVIVRLGWSPKDYPDNDNFKQILSWVW